MTTDPQTALNLRDIHLPGPAAFWPPAPGWWVLAIMVLALLTWGAVVAWRRYRILRQRRRLLATLAVIEEGLGRDRTPEMLGQVTTLLRRVALMRFPRERVASLTGASWLAFLDETGGGGRFLQGPGRVLASGPYQRTLSPDLDAAGLVSLVRDWVGKNGVNRP